jgi:hypothetical protein
VCYQPTVETLVTCTDDEGVVHYAIHHGTWCGWSRTWVGGEWLIDKQPKMVTCIECIVQQSRNDPPRP